MKVLVTGASGFVGGHLCRALVERGIGVRGAVRGLDRRLPGGVRPAVVPDLGDTGSLARAMEGVSHVVHLAARVHVMDESAADPLAEFRRVNVVGTRNILDAARAAGVSRLVFLSSIKVNGEGGPTPYTERDPPLPVDPYGVSKAEAEVEVIEAARHSSLEAVVLRPPLVYGPGVGGNFRRLLRLTELSARVPLPLGGIGNERSLVFVGNLVDALIHLTRVPGVSGQTFLISDGEDLSTSQLLGRLARAGGRSARLLPCPTGVLRGVAGVLGRGAEADRLLGSLTVAPDALRSTGWAPPFTVDEGLARTVEWWRAQRRGETTG